MRHVGRSCAFGAALAVAAGATHAGPGIPVAGTAKSLQPQRFAGTLKPIRAANFTKVGGRMILTSPWHIYNHGGISDGPTAEPAFDCFEADTLGNPVGYLTCGNNANQAFCLPPNPPCTEDVRWFFGQTNPVIPHHVNDMTVGAGFNGAEATRVLVTVNWGLTANPLFVAITTYETFGACTLPAAATEIDGVVLDFGVQTGGLGYFTLDGDLAATPLLLPADGVGAYEIEYGTAYEPISGTFTYATEPGVQSMLWGTGEDEVVPDGRIGTQTPPQWDDDTPPDGTFTANECFQAAFAGICPNPLGAMALFFAEPGVTCYPDCNLVGGLTIADFGCFQTKFVAGDPYADCNGVGGLTIADFGCFQTAFVAGCP